MSDTRYCVIVYVDPDLLFPESITAGIVEDGKLVYVDPETMLLPDEAALLEVAVSATTDSLVARSPKLTSRAGGDA